MNTVEIGARVQSIGTAMLRYGVVVMLFIAERELAQVIVFRPAATKKPA